MTMMLREGRQRSIWLDALYAVDMVEPRKHFIQAHAREVKNLDI